MTDNVEQVRVQDPLFGPVDVRLDPDAGELSVGGDALPGVVVRRAPGTQLEVHVPIGTRDAERLTMAVDGAEARLAPSKGFLTRTSYRVDVHHGGAHYRLIPVTTGESRLLRDGAALGTFVSTGDGVVSVEWRDGAGQEPRDAAVGYGLAASFGTGAEPMWKLTLDAALNLFP
ncbi:hypothetical protein [Streptomyces capillispiralis]|uniref:Uncharacterized protein n=1 Tax=Streptomyces capillispiralis TaxID=68182 RepID=A0A561TEA3_9ACTN|nr:hypothetical protein [Streptomyces capillispiralis]TWF85447.1 hypothetical protein FHX78_112399 [Streptomyces capillispiralis]GHH90142.1 hypothetical protein GCM10017779_05990 [Streptomyces capillispiralis]